MAQSKATTIISVVGTLIGSASTIGITAAGTHLRDRSCETNIALGMELCLAGGCVAMLIGTLWAVVMACFGCEADDKDESYKQAKHLHGFISSTTGLYSMAVFIYMCVQVFRTSADECDDTLYRLGLAFCIIGFVGIGLIIFMITIACCCSCIAACFALGTASVTADLVIGSKT